MTMKRLRKVKWDGEAVLIAYERMTANDEPDRVEVRSSDAPAASFAAALAALAPHVVALCEFSELDLELQVVGISFSYGKSGEQGAVITAFKPLLGSPAPLVLNTPHKPFAPTSEDMPPEYAMDSAQVKALRKVEREAWEYLAGVREQGDLFDVPGPHNDPALLGRTTAVVVLDSHEPVTLGAGA